MLGKMHVDIIHCTINFRTVRTIVIDTIATQLRGLVSVAACPMGGGMTYQRIAVARCRPSFRIAGFVKTDNIVDHAVAIVIDAVADLNPLRFTLTPVGVHIVEVAIGIDPCRNACEHAPSVGAKGPILLDRQGIWREGAYIKRTVIFIDLAIAIIVYAVTDIHEVVLAALTPIGCIDVVAIAIDIYPPR
ncbi:MAG: hypothetical protein AAFX99_09270, partial [Myxococcota bacterium]